jgi:ankyrin repeat protein
MLVLKGSNVRKPNNYLETALHLASRKGHVDIVEFLLDNGADVMAVEQYKDTPLHLAGI